MKTTLLTFLAIACAACSVRATATSSVIYSKEYVYSTPVHVVYVDLNDRNVRVTVGIAKRGRGSSEAASSMVSRTHPTAAITGTFFDTRTLVPTGNILICGTRIHTGCVGSALCITQDNRASIVSCGYLNRQSDSSFETVLQAGPTLVADGILSVNPRGEGFHDRRLSHATRKTAVGITPSNKLVLVSIDKPVSVHRLARIVQRLGCSQAVLLDGGSSTAMYAKGRFLSRPGRRLTNLLLIYEKAEAYRSASGQLAPTILSADRRTAPETLPVQGPWYRRMAALAQDIDGTALPEPYDVPAGTFPPADIPHYRLRNYLPNDDNLR